MLGLMQTQPINLAAVLEHAGRWHGGSEIVTNSVEGGIRRRTYAETLRRAKQFANALKAMGVKTGDRIATMAWNTDRHVEAWYAVMGQGAIAHTVNPRLFPEQIEFIVNHAEDRLLLIDVNLVPLAAKLLAKLPTIEKVIVLTDDAHMPEDIRGDARWIAYETLIADQPETFDWVEVDENTAAGLCYTSGTTGEPKGVLYTHRANLLHAYASLSKDVMNIGATDNILMVVPMFHANSWGLAFSVPMCGGKMVLPGPHMDGPSIHGLIEQEQATMAAAVPTVWTMLLNHLKSTGGKLKSLKEVVIGGSAVPRSMIETFDRDYGVEVLQAWGMTEMTPLGTLNRRKRNLAPGADMQAEYDRRCYAGRAPFGVDMKIVDDDGNALPHDGEAFGRLMVRGPWVIERYFKQSETALENGWFDTGDIASIDADGYMRITDRAKDVIKSGGEWISSVDVENAAMGHPAVLLAACIGVAHPRWEERPLLLVKLKEGAAFNPDDILAKIGENFAKWQLPDAVIQVEDIPLTATGKIDKKPLRQAYKDHLMSVAQNA